MAGNSAGEADATNTPADAGDIPPSQVHSAMDESVVMEKIDKSDTKTVSMNEDDNESFGSKLAYLLTLVGYAVGFGNVWRFPYLVQENGGIAFLVPYCIMLAFLGIPIFFLELAIGQRLRKGPIGTWNEISPYLGGIGIMTGCICFIVGLYYTTLISWCLAYLFDIFRTTLRFSSCGLAVSKENISCAAADIASSNSSIYNEKTREQQTIGEACLLCEKIGASQYYWYYEILQVSPGIEFAGDFNWWIALYLFLAWLSVWGILVKGLKATGKVVYFTALFPYVVLTIFLILGLTLPGMENGFRVLFTPDWSKLSNVKVWMTAGTQIFFSLGLGFGVLIAFASHLPSNNNCYKDAIRVSLINCSTSLYAACVIFSILGFQGTRLFNICKEDRSTQLKQYLEENNVSSFANNVTLHTYNCQGVEDTSLIGFITHYKINNKGNIIPVNETLQPLTNNFINCSIAESVKSTAGGTGLVFIVFASAIAQLPVPQIWGFLFYMMLYTLGIDSAFSTVEGAIASIYDLKLGIKKWIITTVVCSVLFAFSMVFATGWGLYLLTFLDEFNANWGLLIVAFFECIGISWVYGLKQFAYDIKLMTGHRPNVFLMMCWKVIAPIIMFILMVASIIGYTEKDKITGQSGFLYEAWNVKSASNAKVYYPSYVLGIGFLMTIFSVIWIPVVAIFKCIGKPIIKEEAPAYFPEDDLRTERNIVSDEEEDKTHTPLEKALFWGSTTDLRRSNSTTGKVSTDSNIERAGSDTAMKEIPEEV